MKTVAKSMERIGRQKTQTKTAFETTDQATAPFYFLQWKVGTNKRNMSTRVLPRILWRTFKMSIVNLSINSKRSLGYCTVLTPVSVIYTTLRSHVEANVIFDIWCQLMIHKNCYFYEFSAVVHNSCKIRLHHECNSMFSCQARCRRWSQQQPRTAKNIYTTRQPLRSELFCESSFAPRWPSVATASVLY